MHVDEKDVIKSFVEKPKKPPEMHDKPGFSLASMGIYVFETKFLLDHLRRDAADPTSSHDFGKDIIPYLVKHGKAVAHSFDRSCVRSKSEFLPYWRDVGTVDAYWAANIDLTDVVPALDIYDQDWPIWSYNEITPPCKFVHDEDGRRGVAISSLVSGGCIVSGAHMRHTMLSTGARVNSFSSIENAVILPYVDVARSCRLKNVVIDAGVKIPEGLVVGEDPELDGRRFRRTERGICLITQPMIDALITNPFGHAAEAEIEAEEAEAAIAAEEAQAAIDAEIAEAKLAETRLPNGEAKPEEPDERPITTTNRLEA